MIDDESQAGKLARLSAVAPHDATTRFLAGALAFAVGVAFVPGISAAALAPRWLVLAAGVPALLAWRSADLIVDKRYLLFLLWAGVSITWSPDRLGGVNELSHLVIFWLASVLGAVAAADAILAGLSAAVGISALIVCAQLVCGCDLVANDSRLAGLFFNRNILSELAAPLLAWAVVSRERVWAISAGAALALSCDRTAAIALIGVLIWWSWRWRWRPRPQTILCLLVLLSVVVAGLSAAAPRGPLASLQERAELWWDMLGNLEPLGNGAGAFVASYPFYGYAHNDPLQFLYEFGAAAFFLFILFGEALCVRGRYGERAALAVLVIESLASFPLQLPASGFLAFTLVGALGRRRAELRHNGNESRDQLGAMD